MEGCTRSLVSSNVDDRSGNSILLTDVEADLSLPEGSNSLPNTATPHEFKIGSSQGSGLKLSVKRSVVSSSASVASTMKEVSTESLLSFIGLLEFS